MWKKLGKAVAKAVGHVLLDEVKKKLTKKESSNGPEPRKVEPVVKYRA